MAACRRAAGGQRAGSCGTASSWQRLPTFCLPPGCNGRPAQLTARLELLLRRRHARRLELCCCRRHLHSWAGSDWASHQERDAGGCCLCSGRRLLGRRGQRQQLHRLPLPLLGLGGQEPLLGAAVIAPDRHNNVAGLIQLHEEGQRRMARAARRSLSAADGGGGGAAERRNECPMHCTSPCTAAAHPSQAWGLTDSEPKQRHEERRRQRPHVSPPQAAGRQRCRPALEGAKKGHSRKGHSDKGAIRPEDSKPSVAPSRCALAAARARRKQALEAHLPQLVPHCCLCSLLLSVCMRCSCGSIGCTHDRALAVSALVLISHTAAPGLHKQAGLSAACRFHRL